jgi:Uma2 family endonuclease
MNMADRFPHSSQGPFRADQLQDGDRYELTDGHPIYCAPSSATHANRNLSGGSVLETDPDVDWAGVDAGFAPQPGTLRAPDVAIGSTALIGDSSGWIAGVPPLAVEYAAQGQDEAGLQEKISDLLGNGTHQVWVVRLVGPRRVEVYAPGQAIRVLGPGDQLQAPGLLRNPVPVEALYDRDAGHRATLRNLLQRQGYEDLDAVLAEGVAEGHARAVLHLLRHRDLAVSAELEQRIMACRDPDQLDKWLFAATQVTRADDIFEAD